MGANTTLNVSPQLVAMTVLPRRAAGAMTALLFEVLSPLHRRSLSVSRGRSEILALSCCG